MIPAWNPHAEFTRHFIVQGKLIASQTYRRGELFSHDDRAWKYLCPFCGEIWGMIAVEGEGFGGWTACLRNCVEHSTKDNAMLGENLPGSFIYGRDDKQLDKLPLSVLEYEFNLIVQHLELTKKLKGQNQ